MIAINSCDKPTDQGSQIDTYIYENQSGVDIKLTFYEGSNYKKDIEISNGMVYTEKVIIKAPATGIDPCIAFSDSVKIVFSDHKTLFYRPQGGFNNDIYKRYINMETTGKNKTYEFILSSQDYGLAK